jgi:hypothetical protein
MDEECTIVTIATDDMVVTLKQISDVMMFKSELPKHFGITDLGKMSHCLGFAVGCNRAARIVAMNQGAYCTISTKCSVTRHSRKTDHLKICLNSKENFLAFSEAKISKIMNTWSKWYSILRLWRKKSDFRCKTCHYVNGSRSAILESPGTFDSGTNSAHKKCPI